MTVLFYESAKIGKVDEIYKKSGKNLFLPLVLAMTVTAY
jgi:hypothetical protein